MSKSFEIVQDTSKPNAFKVKWNIPPEDAALKVVDNGIVASQIAYDEGADITDGATDDEK